MASRRQDLETHLTVKDDASKTFDKVADKAEQLGKPVEIPLTADDKASADIKSLSQRLAGLSDEEKTIVLDAAVGNAQRKIDGILKSLSRVDQMSDEEVTVRIEALDHAKDDLDRIQAEMRQIDGDTATVHVESTGLDDMLGKLDSLPGKFGEMGGAISSAIGPLASAAGPGGALVAGAAAIGGALLTAANAAADVAIEASTTAKLTGDTVENVSRMQQVWKTTGADVNDLNDIIVQLNGALLQSPELATQLGINLTDGRTALERFVQVVDLADRGLIDMQTQSALFGEEGIRQVAGLTTRYDDLAKTLADMEAPVSKEDAANALKMKQAVADITAQFQKMALELGESVIPALTDAVDLAGQLKIPEVTAASFQPFTKFSDDLERAGETWHLMTTDDIEGTVAEGLGVSAQNARDLDAYLKSILGTEKARNELQQQQIKVYNAIVGALVERRQADVALREEEIRLTTQILQVDDALNDLAGTFEQMGTRGDALRNIFALGNAPLDAAGQVRDIDLAINDLSKTAEELDLSAGLDPSNLKADALLDQLDSLRPQIQAKITEAFEGGGAEAATAMAQDYIAQVAEELDISDVEAAELLGLADVETTIHVAVEQSEVEQARQQLEILTGIKGETPWTASIALALNAGTISGHDAQLLIQEQLKEFGVKVPVELKPEVSKEDHDKANRELDQLRNPADKVRVAPIGPQVDPIMAGETKQDLDEVATPKKPRVAPIVVEPHGVQAADSAIDGVARDRTADVFVVFHYPDGSTSTVPAGGGGPSGGPVMAPMALGAGPAPAVTSSSGGVPGAFMVPVAAPRQQAPVVNLYTVINAGVVGDPFEVARTVEDSTRRTLRLMPVNP